MALPYTSCLSFVKAKFTAQPAITPSIDLLPCLFSCGAVNKSQTTTDDLARMLKTGFDDLRVRADKCFDALDRPSSHLDGLPLCSELKPNRGSDEVIARSIESDGCADVDHHPPRWVKHNDRLKVVRLHAERSAESITVAQATTIHLDSRCSRLPAARARGAARRQTMPVRLLRSHHFHAAVRALRRLLGGLLRVHRAAVRGPRWGCLSARPVVMVGKRAAKANSAARVSSGPDLGRSRQWHTSAHAECAAPCRL